MPGAQNRKTMSENQVPTPKVDPRFVLLGGLLPIAAFAIVEIVYGVKGGLIAGIIFGAGELLWEYKKFGRVQKITMASSALVVVLGAVSLYEDDSVFFKLQPAILLFIFALALGGSVLWKKPLIAELVKKQNPQAPAEALGFLSGVTLRLSLVFLILSAVSVHAAYAWSTANWVILKGVGAPGALVAYMAIEVLILRRRMKNQTTHQTQLKQSSQTSHPDPRAK